MEDSMKKVLLLAPMSSVHERFNLACIDALNELNCDIHIAADFESGSEETIGYNQEYKRKLLNDGIKVHQIPFVRGSFIKNIKAIKRCHKLFIDEMFEMIHCHTETGGLVTRIAMFHCHLVAKYLYTPHGMSFYQGSSLKSWLLYYPIERWICRKMDAVMAINHEEYKMLRSWKKNNDNYIHGTGFDIDPIKNVVVDIETKRSELAIPIDSFLILSIGELNENKNHASIIKAIAQIGNPNIYYLICGEGHLKPHLTNLCYSLNLNDRVIFAGFRTDIAEIVHIADLFAFPSYHEGLPVSLMEAMAASLPVICSNIRGNIDLIENEKGGFLIDPDDINGFQSAIEKLAEDHESRHQMGLVNQENSRQYSRVVVKEEIKNIYQKVMELDA